MEYFAFMIHPLDVSDVARKFPIARFLPARWVERMLLLLPPVKVSHITGIRSPHAEAEGWFVSCPLTARQIISLPPEQVLERVVRAGKLAEQLGAKILGLGAFTKVVGDAGITVAQRLNIPVTTGNSYTVATAVAATREAAALMGYSLEEASVAVVGATGAIGSVCAELLAREVRDLTLVGRSKERLRHLADKIKHRTGLAVKITDDLKDTLRRSDVILTVTSAVHTVIEPEDLKPGAVVCDVARPRDVSRRVAVERPDVLVIEGGVVEVPGEVNFNFNFGFPPRTAYACMAETMILALEGRYESYTLGRDLTVEQVEEIDRLARRHGFKLAGFRSFERALTPEDIERVKENAQRKRKAG
ncbi:shikimate dehydrogenase [Desulfothermobacter acidiphilus]|uniref:shikimate dehydrogenase n=1 Tax=Desulfothermobacter acidiphilus TaxID=1938353 RepID=UPI003F8BD11F